MNKIPTVFFRDMTKQPALVIDMWHPDCLWVRDGEGVATRKYDGTSCLVRAGALFKRRELRHGDQVPSDFESLGTDENTRKTVGWVPVNYNDPGDQWHVEAFTGAEDDGTYELVGPKVQGNKDRFAGHVLLRHAFAERFRDVERNFHGIHNWLTEHQIEGLVFHHPDGRMAKIKRRDFELKW